MSNLLLPRRRFLALGAAGLGGSLLSDCDRLSEAPDFQAFLSSAEWLTYRTQRLLGGPGELVEIHRREFARGHELAPQYFPRTSAAPPAKKVNHEMAPERFS